MGWRDISTLSPETVYSNKQSDFETLFRFCLLNGFNQFCEFRPHINLKTTLQKRRLAYSSEPIYPIREPHYIDHGLYLKNTQTGVICLAYCPYQPPRQIGKSVTEWAADLGLEAHFYEKGWYLPEQTCFVILSKPEYKIRVPKSAGKKVISWKRRTSRN